ncbi:MAG: Gfo/Idh/MocA family protein [Promethearchaeota archaeon]
MKKSELITQNKIALIGCGYWGQNIARVINEINEQSEKKIQLYLFDIDASKAKYLAKKYNFNFVNNIDDIFSNKEISAVLIITPSSTHYDLTLKALNADKDVFVEKPFTLSSKNAEKLIKIAYKKNKILMVGHLFRFHQGIIELKKRIDLGEFGKIYFLYGFKFGMAIPKEDAGVIFTLAVNDFDIFCYILDVEYPTSILAQRGTFIQRIAMDATNQNDKDNFENINKFNENQNLEDIVNVSLTFPNGIQGYLIESWIVPVFGRKRELIIVGSKKTAILNYLIPNEIIFYDFHIEKAPPSSTDDFVLIQENPHKIIFEFQEPLKKEMEHFLECLELRREPISNANIALKALKMCEMTIKSANMGKKIYFDKELGIRGTQ